MLRAVEESAARGGETVLATVVSHEGSVYARAGAMSVLTPQGGGGPGVISWEELGGALRREAKAASAQASPRLCALELAEDDPILGQGLGTPGRIEIFLEPIDAPLREALRPAREALLRGEGVVCSIEIEGPDVGRRALYPPGHPQAKECYLENSPELVESSSEAMLRRIFLCPVHPMGKVLIFGSGADAAALARHLEELGFSVFAADPRLGRLRAAQWDRRQAVLIEGGWEQARAAAGPDAETSVVVMTHSYALDLETLQGALQSPAAYVGLVGPLKSAQRMLSELEALEAGPRPGVLFAPAGLALGAQSPRETALAVAAEILAARSGRKRGLSLRARFSPAPAARGRLPGLILAAGRGRRFGGGHKLSAELGGRAVLRHAVENALASRLDPVIVVLGCDAEAGLNAIEGIEDPRLRVVFNPRWQGGKTSSIEVGLREAPLMAPGVVSLLGDMPRVKAWLIDRVISEFELSGRLTFPVWTGPDGPQKGYPTAFPRALFGEIRALTGDDTAMEAVRRHWAEAVKIPLEDGATQADVDTPEDLQLLLVAPP